MSKVRIGGLIVRDKKLLLVTGYGSQMHWTPGGKMDEGEDQTTTLVREIEEELGMKVKTAQPYHSIEEKSWSSGEPQTCHYFLVEADGDPMPAEEVTGLHWTTKEDLESGVVKVDEFVGGMLVPKLIADNLM